MNEGVDTTELVMKLCQADKEVIWAIGKNNQNLVSMSGHYRQVGYHFSNSFVVDDPYHTNTS